MLVKRRLTNKLSPARLKNKLSCGCVHELGGSERWISLCDRHEFEWIETHNRWTLERFGTISPVTMPNGPDRTPNGLSLSRDGGSVT